MSRKLWRLLFATLLLTACTAWAVMIAPKAQATTVTTLTWPGTPAYSGIYTHGDGSISVGSVNSGCSFSSSTPTYVTMNEDGTNPTTIYGADGDWHVCGDHQRTIVGVDKTIYLVEYNSTNGNYRLAAYRGGIFRWAVNSGTACSSPSSFSHVAMGFDGNIYALKGTGCTSIGLEGIDAATGIVNFITNLPGPDSNVSNELVPYNDGLAIANNGVHVYYYSYQGVLDTSKTFSPTTPATNAGAITVGIDGRTYLEAYGGSSGQFLYYKDSLSSTIYNIAIPSGQSLIGMYSAPSDSLVVDLRDSSNNEYAAYFDVSGNEHYDIDLGHEGNATALSSLGAGPRPTIAVDSLGNIIVVRTMALSTSPYDQEVYVDAFDPSGTETRLFDSEAIFGGSGKDMFTTGPWLPQSIGDGNIYLALCHQTSGSATTCANSSATPQVVAVSAPGSFDTQRSGIFTAPNQYAALGDSYASGEGNSPFEPGTDNSSGDACDRSQTDAYPSLLATNTNLVLRAFVACSGASSDDVYTGKNGEPSQLDSLNSRTAVVTITTGGDDAYFANFAQECVVGTCDSASSQYQNTMDEIDNYLQGNLELLYSRIHAAAPNASIKVIGYPEVVSGTSADCPPLVPGGPSYISSGEKIAIETVITSLNTNISAAVANSGSEFQFVDPTATGNPFDGHDLCSGDSYFFGLNIVDRQYSFHPNADGQAAYAQVIANNI